MIRCFSAKRDQGGSGAGDEERRQPGLDVFRDLLGGAILGVAEGALAGEALPVYGDGRNIRDWLFVGDHCSAIRRVLDAGRVGETYNVGGNAERENIAVVTTICALLDARQPLADGRARASLITYVKDRPGHDRRYAIDSGKLQSELGWQPTHTFESGIAQTVDWYLAHQSWSQRVLDGSYRMERLGS